MSNETMGISGIFLLAVVLLLLRHGLRLICRRRQRPHGVYLVRLNDDDRKPDPDPEPDSEETFYRSVRADLGSLAAPGGHHDDWRRLFLGAPKAADGEVVKAWPWVPIGYAPAFEAQLARVNKILAGLPEPWDGVFLNDLQAGPSSCGCGNDQCRWALDYGSPLTAAQTPGDDAAARLVAELAANHRDRAVIPVWVTECEMTDLPGVPGSTGHCGTVVCAKTSCWPRYSRSWNPLLRASSGPLAVALWSGSFGRDPAWVENGLALFAQPHGGGAAVPRDRVLAVLQGWDTSRPDRAKLVARAQRAAGGSVIALTAIEQSWEPRLVQVPR